MTVATRTIPGNLAVTRSVDTSITNAPQDIASGAAKMTAVYVDNTGNANTVYVKFYDVAASSVTVATTVPASIILVPASTALQFSFTAGFKFSTAISYACVTAGGTGGTTSPVAAVKMSTLSG